VGAISAIGFVAAFRWKLGVGVFLLSLFGLAGLSMAVVDSLEGAMTADLVAEPLRGTAYGILGTVNGIGDLVASLLVGVLWTVFSPGVAFIYASIMMIIGAVVVYQVR
jgi:hypothetical protein